MSKFEINRITKESIRAILRFHSSFLAPKLKNNIWILFSFNQWINFIAKKGNNLGKIVGSHDIQSKWINFIAKKGKNLGKVQT